MREKKSQELKPFIKNKRKELKKKRIKRAI